MSPVDPAAPYDTGNLFARILRGELPCRQVHADEHALAFHDIAPQAPVHVLVIPRGPYVSWDDFSARATDAEIAGFIRAVGATARGLGLVAEGYRAIANIGAHGGQIVPHFHVHILGGRPLGPMLAGD